jgi:hypothetical protein
MLVDAGLGITPSKRSLASAEAGLDGWQEKIGARLARIRQAFNTLVIVRKLLCLLFFFTKANLIINSGSPREYPICVPEHITIFCQETIIPGREIIKADVRLP